ncbi:unnamed protein product [Toxocara canis]|uniref:protein-serine/threonine phosphatase n=1 Tax=Toxocara canis TaxID=6265 RepID=A0A183U239_TOXCA|nr:unnamed protein product [Toxocara canis]
MQHSESGIWFLRRVCSQIQFTTPLADPDVFEVMPFTGCVGDLILCMHGGISTLLKEFQQVAYMYNIRSLLLARLYITGCAPDPRGASYGFGENVFTQTCSRLILGMVARAHRVDQHGYEFFGNRRLVTIFFAPHYYGTGFVLVPFVPAVIRLRRTLSVTMESKLVLKVHSRTGIILRPATGPSHSGRFRTVRNKSEKLTVEANRSTASSIHDPFLIIALSLHDPFLVIS